MTSQLTTMAMDPSKMKVDGLRAWEAPTFSCRGKGRFQHLYELGHIDFVSVRNGDVGKALKWRGPISDIDIATWLPIFMEGLAYDQEPFRFLALRGSADMISSADADLHKFAFDSVGPLRQALSTGEPSIVVSCLDIMERMLKTDPQFGAHLNRFHRKAVRVDMGYSSNEAVVASDMVIRVLGLLQRHGGIGAAGAIKRYIPQFQMEIDGTEALARGKSLAFNPYTNI
ncbi:hypothetical protein BSKO_01060 [Bryopsis sp. KO-2023]|nr:hypothetical protein BSKO_01060 [Bryopsis sp. KO-2023]